ncbi:hypothetical protein E2P81_ATG07530 [Venturia nashicola]|uniref:Uncharacterized protein n=1 Tax=Venturia nashicola TaxID=86259 RepID=A0A4Z1P6U7_9PEZI|nr:hypothetical protein E6O75_ATG07690 [Venturia nashicola]TLD32040.1 hypothetical protein E2P81_ATG07530 [Venturia nashicola]
MEVFYDIVCGCLVAKPDTPELAKLSPESFPILNHHPLNDQSVTLQVHGSEEAGCKCSRNYLLRRSNPITDNGAI